MFCAYAEHQRFNIAYMLLNLSIYILAWYWKMSQILIILRAVLIGFLYSDSWTEHALATNAFAYFGASFWFLSLSHFNHLRGNSIFHLVAGMHPHTVWTFSISFAVHTLYGCKGCKVYFQCAPYICNRLQNGYPCMWIHDLSMCLSHAVIQRYMLHWPERILA